MATTTSSPTTSPQDNPPPGRRGRSWLIILFSALIIFVLVGWQFLSVHTNNTDPITAGQPLSNAQMHLHTLALGGKPGVLYLGTHYGIFTSTDDGRMWPQARGTLDTLMVITIAINPQDANALALVGIPSTSASAPEGVYFSQNGGTNWTLRNPPGLSPSAYPSTLQAGANGRFYAFYLNGGWFETQDMGMHWRTLALHNLPPMQTPALLPFADNPTHLLLGGEQGLFESRDDGQSWNTLPAVQGSVLSLVASKTTPATIFCATDQGLYTWKDGSTAQIKQIAVSNSMTLSRLAIDATGKILYGMAGQNLEYSQDSGAHWTLHKHFSRGDLTAFVLDPYHPEKLYVGFFLPPQVIYSTNSGTGWQIVTGGHTLP